MLFILFWVSKEDIMYVMVVKLICCYIDLWFYIEINEYLLSKDFLLIWSYGYVMLLLMDYYC